MKERKELIEEANQLGLEFKGNISTQKLHEMVEAHYDNEAAGDKPTEKEETVETTTRNDIFAEVKKKALATKVVTITSNDTRTNSDETMVYLAVENMHFAVGGWYPLNEPIEIQNCLIDIAKNTKITLHKDEVIDGRRTGNKVPVRTNAYNVNFEDVEVK